MSAPSTSASASATAEGVHTATTPSGSIARYAATAQVVSRREGDDEPPWRLVVLEDAGELMAASARSEAGQRLSRMLNLTDGLLGQGVRCIMLVTTNEPLGRLHPAVRRPGRCWASVAFGGLPPAEATAWLAQRGADREVTRPTSLAELYAIAAGREHRETRETAFGFARGLTAPRRG